jgi:hypothetical protein
MNLSAKIRLFSTTFVGGTGHRRQQLRAVSRLNGARFAIEMTSG